MSNDSMKLDLAGLVLLYFGHCLREATQKLYYGSQRCSNVGH